MKNRIVTISREFGSGGRTIGQEVARQLGIPCYDQELLEKLAEESGFSRDYLREQGEYAGEKGLFGLSLAQRTYGLTNQDQIWKIQYDLICRLAEEGPCVIVGRCADYILRDKANCLRVFIHASLEKRAERIVREYGERPESPEQRLRDKDKRRATYYRFYTDMKWGQAQNYHISLDSGELGLDRCVDLIKQLY